MNCEETCALLQGWDDLLILCHASPDGDTLGSAAALVRGLRAMGKRASFACGDAVPAKYAYLFEGLEDLSDAPAHIVSVDVADAKLLGDLEAPYGQRVELAIDHHGTHVPFSPRCWNEPDSAATCELIYQLLKAMGAAITPDIARCLFTGIITDTGCFRYSNVTPRTHRIAAELMELGAPADELARRLFETKSRAQAEAERMVLETMEIFCDGKAAMVQVPARIRQETGAQDSDLEGVASFPRQVEGVVLGVTVKEKADGEIHASVRANPPADAAALCGQFGGGGHTGAAGCSFPDDTMEGAARKLKAACAAYLEALGL